jgi:hypothetical protein
LTSAALAGTPSLTAAATAGPDPAALWIVCQRLTAAAERAGQKWNAQRQAGGSGAMAGLLYSAAYEAERQASVAYRAYLAALRASRPGASG